MSGVGHERSSMHGVAAIRHRGRRPFDGPLSKHATASPCEATGQAIYSHGLSCRHGHQFTIRPRKAPADAACAEKGDVRNAVCLITPTGGPCA